VIRWAKQYNVEMPICEQVHEVLYNNASARSAVSALLSRELINE